MKEVDKEQARKRLKYGIIFLLFVPEVVVLGYLVMRFWLKWIH